MRPGQPYLRRLDDLPRFVLMVLFAHAAGADGMPPGASAEPPGVQIPTIGDKTLVAWVDLANTSQRGVGVLGLWQDSRFDAIVFAERMPRRWMAGSDYFRRTPADQSAYPEETATPGQLIQIAVVYRGRHISIFRNGQLYADYDAGGQTTFDGGAAVLMGTRQVGVPECLAGAIEEARLYDRALDPQQLAGLAIGRLSDPKPLGWWTFDDGPRDRMGNFPVGKLCGNAHVAGGRLVLDGRQDYLVVRAVRPSEPQGMFYKPRNLDTGDLWDTWLLFHRGTYYLFALAKSGANWDNFSLATSTDGAHWTEHGRILGKSDDAVWMGTGSTWRSPRFDQDGRFFLNFSEWRGPRQTIFFAQSDDLVQWNRLGREYEFVQDARWYEPTGRWDCIWTIARPGGGLYGYWTATPKRGPGPGFGQSADGVRWEALPPPELRGIAEHGEVGAVEPMAGRYYMLWGTQGKMITLVADRPEGPFAPARKNLDVLAGHTYFARFFPHPDGMLINHHAIARRTAPGELGTVYFGLLKRAVVDAEGTLRLAWWPGNNALKHRPIEVVLAPASASQTGLPAMLANTFPTDRGLVLEGTLRLPAPAGPAGGAVACGLYIECRDAKAAAILVGPAGLTRFGSIGPDGSGFQEEKRADRQMSPGPTARFRLCLRHGLVEFYLDDVLMECYSLPELATGRLGLFDPAAVGELRAWQ
ncbi:MAG: hypothetical protein NUV77_19875 [Thermoguttaceae bacterium]|jgi:hypothetical protein|nr:hypothetical protein [Thermoguttaceae bacterium]